MIDLNDSVTLNQRLDRFVSDAEELSQLLGLDSVKILTYSTGSDRYKRVLSAYEYLIYAEQQFSGANQTKWKHTLVKGKNGNILIACLKDMKGYLESVGEGEPESYSQAGAG